MLLALALLALTLPVFLSCWAVAGNLRGAVQGCAEYALAAGLPIAVGAVLGLAWARGEHFLG